MAKISLTDFVDFVIKSGTPKLTKVRQIKERGEYSPAFDFWKGLREGIIEYHTSGSTNKKLLDNISKQNDEKRAASYPSRVNAYKIFLGRKEVTWFDPPSEVWSNAGLQVSVNPEIGLLIKGTPYIIKLYFKDEPLSKSRVDTVLFLMESALKTKAKRNSVMGVLDVLNSKLITPKPHHSDLSILLLGEAQSFVTMWEKI